MGWLEDVLAAMQPSAERLNSPAPWQDRPADRAFPAAGDPMTAGGPVPNGPGLPNNLPFAMAYPTGPQGPAFDPSMMATPGDWSPFPAPPPAAPGPPPQMAAQPAIPGLNSPIGGGGAPFSIAGGLPPSMVAAKQMAAPPPPDPATQQPPIPGLVPPGAAPGVPPGPALAPPVMARDDETPDSAPTDTSARRREAGPAGPMSMGPAAPADAPKSFGEVLREFSPHLIGLGAGLSGQGWDMSMQVPLLQQKRQEQAQAQNMTARALLARGASPDDVAAAVKNPDLLKALVGKYFETKPAQVVNGRMVRENPDGTVRTLADFSKDDEKKPPSGFEKRPDGTLHFIKGGPADPEYLREKGEKNAAPAGYRWVDPKDPDKGLVAIAGGPGEKVTPEVSARLGLAKSFLGQLPDIQRDIAKGDATGPWDAAMAKAGIGRAGELRRQIASGAEALLRNLTGAGMSNSEAQKYVSRYELQPWDTAPVVKSKLDQLERELRHTIAEVEKGRSPLPSDRGSAAGPLKPASGTVDIGGAKIPWSVN